ncbi:hypothetical protein G6F27_014013 [Rhizopus arrhizus]|nr:hypothetical protein G6F27_014094 [Rhizopus arrhizus]KAG0995673.1 hypothetical protein G6F27_014013 [Rhizopus arrhizus]KAG1081786.1 hypothetical protein G6F39_013805 [Rhizopus arrhizus]KAG1082373.1 hypothetical protein G6F39_013657 [Rhizopus arrhizus]
MATFTTGHIALANTNMNASYRPVLIDFHGYEGEDFRHFLEILESYFAINNITQEPRKLTILKAQLRGAAKVTLNEPLHHSRIDTKLRTRVQRNVPG